MKKKYTLVSALVVICLITIYVTRDLDTQESKDSEISKLREKHKNFLDNSPFKKTRYLTKKERKASAMPPNAFFEQNWDRTIDPNLGYPNFKNAEVIQAELIAANPRSEGLGGFITPRAPGDAPDNAWIERGPNNVGGRTRAILFDPNDANNQRVFTGGVSGGLWVNDDITDANSEWQLVTGVPENIAISQIISDPNDSQIFYIASGESYTFGSAIGNGVYQSTDGGVNWSQIFGGPDGTSTPQTLNNGTNLILLNGILYINDIIARDVNGTTELYITAASEAGFREIGFTSNPIALLGENQRGVYRSTDNGSSWSLIPLSTSSNAQVSINPNDLELDANNNIWLTTTSNRRGGVGGDIFRSSNGTTFNLINTIPNAARTELAASSQDPNVFYVAINQNGPGRLFVTNNAFSSFSSLNIPSDAETAVANNDYTRGQANFDLPIEVDPTDDTILYIGGINWFRGNISVANNGSRSIAINAWQQMSIEGTFGFNGVQPINVSVVHTDQHALTFRPGNSNQAIFANDGGIYYGNNLAASNVSGNGAIEVRNNGYAVTQFYSSDINDIDGTIGGGTQDNGTPFNLEGDSNVGINPFFVVAQADGTFGQFDDDGSYFIGSRQNLQPFFIRTPISNPNTVDLDRLNGLPTISNVLPSTAPAGSNDSFFMDNRRTAGQGNFINEMQLDANLDILYINATSRDNNNNIITSQIRRYSNFAQNRFSINQTDLTNNLLAGDNIASFQTSPFETNASRLLVGTEQGTLLNLENAQANPTWTSISGPQFVGTVADIEFGENENTIMVTLSNYGVESVFYTENGGATWTPKEGDLPDIPVFAILQNPINLDEAIVGTQFGVFRTENFLAASPNWVQSFNGMSNVPVRDLDLRPSTNEVLASTYGRGVFTGQFTAETLSNDDFVLEADDQIILSPSISNGQFSLNSNKSFNDLTMEIYNLAGQIVYNTGFEMLNNTQDFNLNLQSGLYLVKIGNQEFSETKKIVIK